MILNKFVTFKLMQFNANGLCNKSNLTQLEYLLEKEFVNIASLNETYFSEQQKIYLKNYYVYRNDRVNARGGGVALVVPKSL